MLEIIPSILTNNLVEARQMLVQIEGVAKRVHIDIIDGVFANNKTIIPQNLLGTETELLIDYHLMVEDPIKWVEACAHSAADRIIAQVEMMPSQVEFVQKVTQIGLGIGLAIDLDTPLEKLDPEILTDVDVVLVMGVEAGFGGQKFDLSCLEKIKILNKIRSTDTSPYKICADGGETLEIVDDVVAAGVDEVVIGRRLFEGDIAANINKFIKAANNE